MDGAGDVASVAGEHAAVGEAAGAAGGRAGAVVEEPFVGAEGPVEPECVVEAGADDAAGSPDLTVGGQHRVEEAHVAGVGEGAGVDERVVGEFAVEAHPDALFGLDLAVAGWDPSGYADVADVDGAW